MNKTKYKRGDIVRLDKTYLDSLTDRSEQACTKVMRPYYIADILFEGDFRMPNIYLAVPITSRIGPTILRLNEIASSPEKSPASVLVANKDDGTPRGLLMTKAILVAEKDIYDLFYNPDGSLFKIKTYDRFGFTHVRTGDRGRIKLSQDAIAKQIRFAPDMTSLEKSCYNVLRAFVKLDMKYGNHRWTEPFNVSAELVAGKYNIYKKRLTKQYLNLIPNDRRQNDVDTRTDLE